MRTSAAGYALIRKEEGLALACKEDAGGKQQIGYGHDLLPGESFPDGIDEAQAERLLGRDVVKCEAALDAQLARLRPQGGTQNQYDALIDFTYECGRDALRQLLAHGWDQVTAQLPRWVHAHVNGQVVMLPGMAARRQTEIEMFLQNGMP